MLLVSTCEFYDGEFDHYGEIEGGGGGEGEGDGGGGGGGGGWPV
jgi:hypothetical protein